MCFESCPPTTSYSGCMQDVVCLPVRNSQALPPPGIPLAPPAGSLNEVSVLTVGGFIVQVKGSIASSSPLELTTTAGGAAQVFVAGAAPNNNRLTTVSGGLCLDLANGATAPGSPVQVYTCLSPYPAMNPSQLWVMDSRGRLRPRKAAHMCLDVTTLAAGGTLVINPCGFAASQVFTVTTAGMPQHQHGTRSALLGHNNILQGGGRILWLACPHDPSITSSSWATGWQAL